MTDSERLAALEKVTMEQAHELMAMELVLRALIVSHPSPGVLKQSLEVLAGNFSDTLRDHAFDTNRSPSTVQAVASSVESQVSRWLALCRA
jgi:hypothetical protein